VIERWRVFDVQWCIGLSVPSKSKKTGKVGKEAAMCHLEGGILSQNEPG